MTTLTATQKERLAYLANHGNKVLEGLASGFEEEFKYEVFTGEEVAQRIREVVAETQRQALMDYGVDINAPVNEPA